MTTDKKIELEFKNIYQKMIRIQAEMPTLEKTKKVDAGAKKYSHAELDKILSIILPVLRKYNVFYHAVCVDGLMWRITLTDADSGEQLISDMPIIGAVDMQKVGSAITYNCRYGLLGLLGLCPGVDDDGQKACDPVEEKPKLSVSERNRLTFELHELWKIKEGIVRAQENTASTKAVNMFKDDFQGAPDAALIKLREWIASL